MDIAEKLLEVQRLKAEIDMHGKLPDEILRKINYKFRLDWNYYSNSMEGSTLTKKETRSIMVGNITIGGKPLKDVLEMTGHDEVVNSILRMGKGELTISERRIKDIHKAIMNEEDEEKKKEIGEWKLHPNEIINYKNEKFDFTPPSQVIEKMHELVNWLGAEADKIKYNKKDAPDPALLAFEFHLRYLTIHPFYDGNGRTGRILMNLVLISYGYPPVIINDKQKQTYYQYLADVQVYDAPKDLYYDFMTDLLINSLQLVVKAIKGESIEEPDDLDKKIALLAKQIEGEEDSIKFKKSIEVLEKTYEDFLKEFIERIEGRLIKFNSLFLTHYSQISAQSEDVAKSNNSYYSDISEVITIFVQDIKLDKLSFVTITKKWAEFKKAGNPFGAAISVYFFFNRYDFHINIAIGEYSASTNKSDYSKIEAENDVFVVSEIFKSYYKDEYPINKIDEIVNSVANVLFQYIEYRLKLKKE